METITSTLLEIPIKDIRVTDTNPRRTFDEKSLEALTASIKLKGVLQPILVRPAEDKYELVCGERRYRSSMAAGLTSIPANVRELSDDEAFEAMIIENLERKDVHPLEEAEAFKKMTDSGRYSIEDIAAKVARSAVYVTQRLQLVALIPEIKQDFYENVLNISQAILLARVGEETQADIHEETKRGWHGPYYGTARELQSRLSRDHMNLNKAPFKTQDPLLIKGVGSCDACPKRSGANPSLFADVEHDNTCFDVGCYNRKLSAHLENLLCAIADGEKPYLVGKNYSSVPDQVADYCKKLKIPILKEWDDFNTASGKGTKRLLMVSGSDLGRVVTVELKAKGIEKAEVEDQGTSIQIEKIKQRASRALELDNEKIEASVRNLFTYPEKGSEFYEANKDIIDGRTELMFNPDQLHGSEEAPFLEYAVLLLALEHKGGYAFGDWLANEVGLKRNWGGEYAKKLFLKLLDKDIPFANRVLREFAWRSLSDRQVSDRRTDGYSDAIYRWVHLYCPLAVDSIQAEQDDKAAARIGRTKQRITKLKEDAEKDQPTKPAKRARAKKKETTPK